MTENPCTDILITIAHNWGERTLSLRDWIEEGPGDRPLLRPNAAWCERTGKRLPLNVIPLAYRNNRLSRLLITLGIIKNPWLMRPAKTRNS